MSVDDYDILSILGNNINSTTYKVQHKESKKIFVWQTHEYENKSNSDKEYLLEKITYRSGICHPNILKFYSHIDQKQNKIIYLTIDYCENGSLNDMINLCLNNNSYFSEELVCKILYQIAFAIKTVNCIGQLSTNQIFIDQDFNVKLFNFELSYKSKAPKELRMCHLGLILYEICSLTKYNGKKCEEELKRIENIFSRSLLSLITCLIKDKTELRKKMDKILCHPTVLLKSTQWKKEKSFIKLETLEKPIILPKEDNNVEDISDIVVCTKKLEKLKIKEKTLQFREQELQDREYKLVIKERKIALMERAAKEKLRQAEICFKRCKEAKSVCSKSSKSISHSQKNKSYEHLDSTYVSCEDSVFISTSSKLNVNKIIKPAPFTRTLSERRIRFKGHSPLKEIDFNKRRTSRQSKAQKEILFNKNTDWLTCSEDTDKSSAEGNSKRASNKVKQLFSLKNTYENDNLIGGDVQSKPIIWTEEHKKCAFELLRTMNVNKENQYPEVKHTCL